MCGTEPNACCHRRPGFDDSLTNRLGGQMNSANTSCSSSKSAGFIQCQQMHHTQCSKYTRGAQPHINQSEWQAGSWQPPQSAPITQPTSVTGRTRTQSETARDMQQRRIQIQPKVKHATPSMRNPAHADHTPGPACRRTSRAGSLRVPTSRSTLRALAGKAHAGAEIKTKRGAEPRSRGASRTNSGATIAKGVPGAARVGDEEQVHAISAMPG